MVEYWPSLNRITRFDLRPPFKGPVARAVVPEACWRGLADGYHQHLHIGSWGTNIPSSPPSPQEQIHMVGSLWTVGKIHCCHSRSQIPSLVDSKGKSIWLGHVCEGKCSWQVLDVKFSLKLSLLKFSSCWGSHINFPFNLGGGEGEKSQEWHPRPSSTLLKLAQCWKIQFELRPASRRKLAKGGGLSEAVGSTCSLELTDTGAVNWWAHNDSPKSRSWTQSIFF